MQRPTMLRANVPVLPFARRRQRPWQFNESGRSQQYCLFYYIWSYCLLTETCVNNFASNCIKMKRPESSTRPLDCALASKITGHVKSVQKNSKNVNSSCQSVSQTKTDAFLAIVLRCSRFQLIHIHLLFVLFMHHHHHHHHHHHYYHHQIL